MSAAKGLAFVLMYFTWTAFADRVKPQSHLVADSDATIHEQGNCMSAAQKKFADISKRGNVQISDTGVVTLPKLKNTIPFEGIKKPGEELPAIAAGKQKYKPVMKTSEPHVKDTLSDLKELVAIVGIKAMQVVGMAGGKSYMSGAFGPGGAQYKPEWKDAWIKVAEARAEAIVQALGLKGHSGLKAEGQFVEEIGVKLSVTALLKIGALKTGPQDTVCADQGPALTADEMVKGVKEVLSRGRIAFAKDESIEFKDQQFLHNIIPFVPCKSVSGVDKGKRMVQCVPDVEITNDKGQKQAVVDAMKDIADLARIADVTSLEVVGFSKPGDANPEQVAAAQKLGAARARFLVQLLMDKSSSTRMSEVAKQVHGKLTACIGSKDAAETKKLCDPVSKFGKFAVEIKMATLVNPSALGA